MASKHLTHPTVMNFTRKNTVDKFTCKKSVYLYGTKEKGLLLEGSPTTVRASNISLWKGDIGVQTLTSSPKQ